MAASGRLKVYRTTAGFYETVVAAPNQGEALKAWGVRQNLFAEGAADVVDDKAVVDAALAAPGQPLRRPIGSKGQFVRDPDELPTAPRGRKPGAGAKAAKPDRRALDRAEAATKALETRQADEAAAFDRRRTALEKERAAAEAGWSRARKAAADALEAARRAYRKAGGAL